MRGRLLLLRSLAVAVIGAAVIMIESIDNMSAARAQPRLLSQVSIDFEAMTTGAPPQGFSIARSGEGAAAQWMVVTASEGATSKVLIQTSMDRTNYRFPLCIYDGFTGRDVALSVRFRPISGTVDQAAGLVWRYRDANNYYVVRANALEGNVVAYRMQDGRRSDLKPVGTWFFSYGARAQVPRNEWSTLEVVSVGNRFSVSINGMRLYDVVDDTFPESGKAGLWTKADSVTQFDDFMISTTATQ